ncbi:glycoside hydrolase family 3 C-terminal domain-containing protein [Actinoallomurus spadix]|uniref:Glycoside hydrolase family 3 N-terminal domain-containing protein n=1 Tax=Actinoallomurus spadix TaxID=79912 RepID=A0ABP3H0P0_9ACTN|nr:glycoside hydrolase family 3 N-terminal domain-containing protein [Actinoallomurus spadix]MCO5987865.1 glycoside hydrolase family 3 C-terminal domain-containing protein [Actinoallomurus spadix]
MAETLPHPTRPTGSWRDRRLPTAERVADLLSRMTVEEKAAQLVGYWAVSARPGEEVAPLPDDFGEPPPLGDVIKAGLGQLTRVFGTAPVPPAEGAARLRELQARVAAGNRFGIPAIAHEECLTGFMTHTATVFPSPLAWGATFDPELVEEMAGAIADSMRQVGVHQGLAPVLDVTRDARWGRTEETIGEDPYLVGRIGTAYVRGLESHGIVATLKHFAAYASSRAGRNMASAAIGPREYADIVLEPFLLALREGGARSVMAAYVDVDGVPAHADERLMTRLLRDELGFTGIVVADYFGISFLEDMHGVAGSPGESAALALRAGVDVELPTIRCYGAPLVELVRRGAVPEEHLDRSVSRVLTLKCELGLLDEAPTGAAVDGLPVDGAGDGVPVDGATDGVRPGDPIDLDPPAHRRLARRVAEESVVLLANDGTLPLRAGRVAVTGPLAADARAMMGCYAFPNHMTARFPDLPFGVEIPPLGDALRAELSGAQVEVTAGHDVLVTDDADIAAAVAAARRAEVCVLTLGDRADLFGRGTSGEGCDAESLALPGRQAELADAVLATGTPTVIVLLAGRPYALGGLVDRAAAIVQAFFPGEEGGPAVAGVLSGRVEPSGRLPVSVPHGPGGQPATYLHSRTGGPSRWSSIDPTPLFPFGHGLTWTRFAYDALEVDPSAATDGTVRVAATVRNTGDRPGTEVVQLYLGDPVCSVVRPVRWLAGWARVRLEPGAAARVEFTVHADRTSFTDLGLRRIVEPGRIDVAVGRSSADLPLQGAFTLTGPERVLGPDRVLTVPVEVTPC